MHKCHTPHHHYHHLQHGPPGLYYGPNCSLRLHAYLWVGGRKAREVHNPTNNISIININKAYRNKYRTSHGQKTGTKTNQNQVENIHY